MSIFSSIPVRSNGDTVDASWWNTIRTALINAGGSTIIDESQATIGNGSTSYTSISGLSFDHSTTRTAEIAYSIYRTDGTVSRREFGRLFAMYRAQEGTWFYERDSRGDDALGNGTVTDPLIVNSSGQVQYKSDSFAAGTIRFKTVVTFAKET